MFLLYSITVEIRHNMYESTLWLTLYNYSSSSAMETHVMKLLGHNSGADVNATDCWRWLLLHQQSTDNCHNLPLHV